VKCPKGNAPDLSRFGQDVKIVHFVGAVKPWDAGEPGPAADPADTGRRVWWELYSLQVLRRGR
jgi:hypothetical protein